MMDNKRLEKWKLKTKGIFHKITYDEFWFYIDDLMKENKKLTNNWHELEEWLKSNEEHFAEAIPFRETLRKMEEIKEKTNVQNNGKNTL